MDYFEEIILLYFEIFRKILRSKFLVLKQKTIIILQQMNPKKQIKLNPRTL